ncbi:MAG: RdgB/HAM1 family non-canonical purine NTP pyrophosphatase [Anaerovoracaceae bacterium]|jgi:XTP/dITP diphosphohydrolase
MKIIAATHNKDKIREIRQILADAGVCIVSMSEAGLDALDVEENGSAFEENATLKAEEVTRLTGIAALADDSGLCVDALAGAPGIYSARYAGPEADTRANNAKLLEAMRDVPEAERTGRYVSAVALAYPDGRLLVVRGECEGRILFEERGSGGFGYDTLFAPEGSERSFAEMSAEEKNRISQRSRALAQLRDALTHED